MSIEAFSLAIDRFIQEDVPEEVGKLARLVGAAALQKVVLKSPVDTGRFRSGWSVTIAERTDAAPAAPVGVKPGARGKSTRAAAVGANVITEGMGVISRAKPFESIILQNNVEYGEELEGGSSTQAPRGMISLTATELQQVFK